MVSVVKRYLIWKVNDFSFQRAQFLKLDSSFPEKKRYEEIWLIFQCALARLSLKNNLTGLNVIEFVSHIQSYRIGDKSKKESSKLNNEKRSYGRYVDPGRYRSYVKYQTIFYRFWHEYLKNCEILLIPPNKIHLVHEWNEDDFDRSLEFCELIWIWKRKVVSPTQLALRSH